VVAKAKATNTKHKYRKSKMSNSIDNIMAIMWQDLPAITFKR